MDVATTGIGCGRRNHCVSSEAKWADRPIREFQRRLAVSRAVAIRTARAGADHRRRPDDIAKADGVAGYVGMQPGKLFLQYEG